MRLAIVRSLSCAVSHVVLGLVGFRHSASARKRRRPTNLKSLKLRNWFISATKTEIPVKQVTSAVEIITGEQMQQRKIKTVVDALRLAQGLAVFQSGGPGTLAEVRMRGGTPEQTLVLIDGAISIARPIGSFNFANLTTDNIERIEILRGSQGMMWGSDAMGGVINIITKRGRETPTISAFAEYGSFATIREGASLIGKKGPVDVAARSAVGIRQISRRSIIGVERQNGTDFTIGKGR